MEENLFDIPIVLFVFRRLDTVKLIMEKVKEIKPKTFYVFSDGPRIGKDEERKKVLEVREYITNVINWDCDLHMEFSEYNKGCANNICGGINTVFHWEKTAIILEDDAVPLIEFFLYCSELLKIYEKDKRIQFIAGFNAVGDTDTIQHSYSFSKSAPMSGAIATWADRWNECDFKMKNWPDNFKQKKLKEYFYFNELYRVYCQAFEDSYKNINDGWDYQFHHDMLDKERVAIVPRGNLVKSYGYTEGAFHPQSKREAKNLNKIMDYTKESISFPMEQLKEIIVNVEYDQLRQKYLLQVKGNYIQRHMYYLKRRLKDLAYKYIPKSVWNSIKKIVKKQ